MKSASMKDITTKGTTTKGASTRGTSSGGATTKSATKNPQLKSTRVEIGTLVVRGSGVPLTDGAALGRSVQEHLERLLRLQGAPAKSRRSDVVRLQRSGAALGASGGDRARAIANAVYRSLQAKD
jgi:2-hydroxychromene-2-carboxylate isomerase